MVTPKIKGDPTFAVSLPSPLLPSPCLVLPSPSPFGEVDSSRRSQAYRSLCAQDHRFLLPGSREWCQVVVVDTEIPLLSETLVRHLLSGAQEFSL